MPLISVIVPAYNCELYLEQSLRSIQDQTLGDFDVVIVDDGSTDGTRALAESIAQGDARIRVITQLNTGGPAVPRNRGIAESSGTYVAFLDPDDYWYPTKLERQADTLRRFPDVDLIFNDADLVDAHGASLGTTYLGRVGYPAKVAPHVVRQDGNVALGAPTFLAFSAVRVMGAQTSGVMVRRSALTAQAEHFAVDLPVGEDVDLYFRIMQKGRTAFIDAPLHAYRQHASSLMKDSMRVLTGQVATHARNFDRLSAGLSDTDRRAYALRVADQYFSLAYHTWRGGNAPAARAAYRSAFRWHPAAKTASAYLKTFLPAPLVRLLRS